MEDLFDSIQSFSVSSLKPTTTNVSTTPINVTPTENVTGAPTPAEAVEFFEDEETTRLKAKQIASLIKNAKRTCIYTGAGISTAANIPDYRGPQGVWTLMAQGKRPTMKISLEQATPTYSHMAIVELLKRGLCSFVVSTNVDGLHRRSGVKKEQLAEVHGNIYKEYCDKCSASFVRMFAVNKSSVRRWTGRLCDICKVGKLRDSIINFGENLPEDELNESIQQSKLADLAIVIGSSMRVTPASDFPSFCYENGGKFCIINLQKTPYDHAVTESGGVRVFERCDQFFRLVMKELDIEVNPFVEDIKDFEAELNNLIPDPTWDGDSIMKKYNVYSMADEGPPPRSVLDQITNGFELRKVRPPVEKNGDTLGKTLD